MKKSVVFLFIVILAAMLSGCILSKSPSTNPVAMTLGEVKTFSVNVFPTGGTYAWTLDSVPLVNADKSYVYTAQAGVHVLTVKAKHFLGTDTQTWNVLTDNSPPVANAGADRTVLVDTTVTLNGTGSTDPDNNISSYHWQQTGGPTVTLTNANAAIVQFTAAVSDGSVLTFKLTVTDTGGLQSTDTCTITVQQTITINWADVAAGYMHTAAIRADGSLWASGNNSYGQLGDGTNIDKLLSTQIGNDTNWAKVAAGYSHTVAIKTDGSLWAWGGNAHGELGDGTNIDKNVPTRIGLGTNWAVVFAGSMHNMAIKTDGSLWAWGWNTYGQVGDGTGVSKYIPTRIGVDTWTVVAPGLWHTMAIKSDGSLWAWGYNGYGQLGNGTMLGEFVPKQIGTDTNWSDVAAGELHTVAIKTDGSLWAWGYNGYGQLGDGTNIDKNIPTRIGIGSDWAVVAAGGGEDYFGMSSSDYTLAIKTNGSLWAWGSNGYGQLGDGTNIDKNIPTRIGTDTNWAEAVVSAGSMHNMAIKSDGSLWAWGYNGGGQHGDGGTVDKNIPWRIY